LCCSVVLFVDWHAQVHPGIRMCSSPPPHAAEGSVGWCLRDGYDPYVHTPCNMCSYGESFSWPDLGKLPWLSNTERNDTPGLPYSLAHQSRQPFASCNPPRPSPQPARSLLQAHVFVEKWECGVCSCPITVTVGSSRIYRRAPCLSRSFRSSRGKNRLIARRNKSPRGYHFTEHFFIHDQGSFVVLLPLSPENTLAGAVGVLHSAPDVGSPQTGPKRCGVRGPSRGKAVRDTSWVFCGGFWKTVVFFLLRCSFIMLHRSGRQQCIILHRCRIRSTGFCVSVVRGSSADSGVRFFVGKNTTTNNGTVNNRREHVSTARNIAGSRAVRRRAHQNRQRRQGDQYRRHVT